MTVDTGTFTAASLLVIWGVLWSFGLEYIPGVKTWFSTLEPGLKQSVNAGGIVFVAAVAYGLSLGGVINAFSPDLEGVVAAAVAVVASLGIGQGVHLGTKRSS